MDNPSCRSSQDLAQQIRAAGLKATAPRVAILATLLRHRTHPSAERLHELLRREHPSVSLSTVYKTLGAFLRVGLCRQVDLTGQRLRVDGRVDAHQHAVCRRCRSIFDIGPDELPLHGLPEVLGPGHRVVGVRLELEIVCQQCLQGGRTDLAGGQSGRYRKGQSQGNQEVQG